MTRSSASQQNKSISTRQAISVDNDPINAILALIRTPGKIEQWNFPALQEETKDPHDIALQDVPNVQDGHHLIPGRRTTSENGDPANEQLLQDEQSDIEAVRILLGLAILNNAITVKHYWSIVMSLRDKLLQAGPPEVPRGEAYARVLLRLAERLTTYPDSEDHQDSEYLLYSCRRNYVGCLSKLLTDMAEGFVYMQQTGMEDDVYIKNKELHTDYLCYLASRLRGA